MEQILTHDEHLLQEVQITPIGIMMGSMQTMICKNMVQRHEEESERECEIYIMHDEEMPTIYSSVVELQTMMPMRAYSHSISFMQLVLKVMLLVSVVQSKNH